MLSIRISLSVAIFDQYRRSLVDSVDDALMFNTVESKADRHARLDAVFDDRPFLRRDELMPIIGVSETSRGD